MKTVISVHYGEIALKGQNRCEFEARLVKNIKKSLAGINVGLVKRRDSRIIIEIANETEEETAEISKRLTKVFGIECFFVSYVLDKDIDKITEFIIEYVSKNKNTIALPTRINVKRNDKKFPATSPEIGTKIARALDKAGIGVELTGYKSEIYVQILPNEALLSFGKISGPGGLPVGSSGKVLVLLSGGIDSPVAAIRMMKRGCTVDLLHFYQFPDHKEVLQTMIMRIIAVLSEYGFEGKLYLAPYSEFYKHTFDSVPPRKELILFRRFILRVANEMAVSIG